MDKNARLAQNNFSKLRRNPYPGRGIVAGLDETSTYLIQVYWITGRSENSRNRVLKSDDNGRVYTEAADAAKMKDPALVIYNAMRERKPYFIVSNGDQTDTVADSNSHFLNEALQDRTYEPDAPNFTQRITAMSSFSDLPHVQLSVLRKSMFGEQCDHVLYQLVPAPGYGYCITTYAGDGDPLPSFRGDPLILPLIGGMEKIAHTYWNALNRTNLVSLAVKFIELKNGHSSIYIINKYAQSVVS